MPIDPQNNVKKNLIDYAMPFKSETKEAENVTLKSPSDNSGSIVQNEPAPSGKNQTLLNRIEKWLEGSSGDKNYVTALYPSDDGGLFVQPDGANPPYMQTMAAGSENGDFFLNPPRAQTMAVGPENGDYFGIPRTPPSTTIPKDRLISMLYKMLQSLLALMGSELLTQEEPKPKDVEYLNDKRIIGQ